MNLKPRRPRAGPRGRIALIILAILLPAAAFQWYAHKDVYISAARSAAQRAFPCSFPVTYAVGGVDPRFNLASGDLAACLGEAEALWEAAAGRDLFERAAGRADVTVNLVYDRRQAALDMLRGLGLVADQSLAVYKKLKARYDLVSAQLAPRQAALAARRADFAKGEKDYNAIIAEYHRRGAATERQLKLLAAAKAALEREAEIIEGLERGVEADADLLDALATTMNQFIVVLELNTEQYRREGAAMGVYEEGVYAVEDGLRRIDVYKYGGRAQLVRLLAHEMGHALGLGHVPGPDSLMSRLDRGGSPALLPEALAELDRACASPLRAAGVRRRL